MIDSAELDDRIAKCEKILGADANSQIFAALAEAYRKKGILQKAQEICEKGLKIHPRYAPARIVMAKIHMAAEDFDRAWGELKQGIEASGRTRAIDMLESEILIRKGRKREAKALLQRLYLSDPEDETIKNLMRMLGEGKTSGDLSDVVMPDVVDLEETESRPRISFSKAIDVIKVTPRVLGVVAVDDRGLVLEGRLDSKFAREELGALARGIFDISNAGSDRIELGATGEILIETKSSKLWLIKRSRFLLVILTRSDVSLGSLKLKIEDLLSRTDQDD